MEGGLQKRFHALIHSIFFYKFVSYFVLVSNTKIKHLEFLIVEVCANNGLIDGESLFACIWFRFSENIITDPGSVDIFPASRIPNHLHHLFKPIYGSGSRDNIKEKGFRITTEPGTLSSILQWTSDAEVVLI